MLIEAVTNRGLRRKINEDRFLVNALDNGRALLVIADGMGGHAAGEVAAQIAVDSFEDFSPPDRDIRTALCLRMDEAHHKILEYSMRERHLKDMGTTLTALFITGGSAVWAHLGDTRIYHLHAGSLIRVTDDHTVPGTLVKRGAITVEQARFHPYGNVLTRCAGCERHEPDTGAFDLVNEDLVFLSSDGLHDVIGDSEIADILRADAPVREKLDRMVSICLEAGGRDNITGILAAV
jgi:protein phosphatase